MVRYDGWYGFRFEQEVGHHQRDQPTTFPEPDQSLPWGQQYRDFVSFASSQGS